MAEIKCAINCEVWKPMSIAALTILVPMLVHKQRMASLVNHVIDSTFSHFFFLRLTRCLLLGPLVHGLQQIVMPNLVPIVIHKVMSH
jgi:hypothetical protein